MDWKTASDDWLALVPQITTRWPELEEEEVEAVEGNREAFVTLLAATDGRDREIAETELADFLEGFEPLDARMDERNDNETIRDSRNHLGAGEDVYDDDVAFGDETKER